MKYSTPENSATAEAELFALIKRDAEVLRAREIEDEASPPPKRKPFSAVARASIAAGMRGNSNRKTKSQPVVSPAKLRRAAHG
jgi:hypothetical protein